VWKEEMSENDSSTKIRTLLHISYEMLWVEKTRIKFVHC
jgi:hypothetical protein